MKHKITLALFAAAAMLTSCNKMETTENGVEYKIIKHEEGTRMVATGDILLLNLRIATEKTDSVILETYTGNSPRYIPSDEPVLKEVFAMLSKGDSAEIWVNADTLFQKSFGTEKPKNIGAGEKVKFIVTLVDVFNQQEMQQKQQQQMSEFVIKDSLAVQAFLATQQNVQTTASGLNYIVVKKTTGKQASKGNKVSMLYKGTLLNGEVFDQNMDGSHPAFEFTLGLGQVIPGWDEAVSMMKEGEEYKVIIPWRLAYGERGAGPIPPFSSLVFDVKLVKVN
ncbi:MAG: FKBP-type peptidyl-prolyl cis-trans isomerase [Bacteroidota bacterium]